LYEFAVVEAAKYAEGFTWEEGQKLFWGTYGVLAERYNGLLLMSYLGLIALWFAPTDVWKKAGISLLFLASFWTITPGWRFYGHYWLMWMPFVALAGAAAAYALQRMLQKFQSSFASYVPLLFILPLLLHLAANKDYYFNPNFTKLLKTTYGGNPFVEVKKVGDFLSKKVAKDDKIALVGSEPQLYVYTGCDSPTRHAYFTYLMLDTLKTPQAMQWQKEYIADVEREKPRFIVFTSHPVSVYGNPNSDMRFFDWFTQYINANYNRIGCADMPEGQPTNFVLTEAEIKGFNPKSRYFVDVYERKKEAQ
jgi:hypothetical protein